MAKNPPNPLIPIEQLRVFMQLLFNKAQESDLYNRMSADAIGMFDFDARDFFEDRKLGVKRKVGNDPLKMAKWEKAFFKREGVRETEAFRKLEEVERKQARRLNKRELKKLRVLMPPGEERRYQRLIRSALTDRSYLEASNSPANINRKIKLLKADWFRNQTRRDMFKKTAKFAVKPALPSPTSGAVSDKVARTLLRLITRGRSG